MKTFIITAVTLITSLYLKAQVSLENSFSISLEIENETSVIRWTMQKEVNTSYFLIQKSTDSVHFFTVKTLKAYGSTQTSLNYETEDVLDTTMNNYYRVVLVQMEGKQIISNVECSKPSISLFAKDLIVSE
jgi:hypothetical protein